MLGILRSYMNWAPAPKWIIECRNCAARFIHSEVGKDRRVIAYLYPTEPKFSLHGEELECPSCKSKATYILQDLRYQFL